MIRRNDKLHLQDKRPMMRMMKRVIMMTMEKMMMNHFLTLISDLSLGLAEESASPY